MKKPIEMKNWEEEFDKEFSHPLYRVQMKSILKHKVKSFIRQLLSQREKA